MSHRYFRSRCCRVIDVIKRKASAIVIILALRKRPSRFQGRLHFFEFVLHFADIRERRIYALQAVLALIILSCEVEPQLEKQERGSSLPNFTTITFIRHGQKQEVQ